MGDLLRILATGAILPVATSLCFAQGPARPDLLVDTADLAAEWSVGFRYFPPGHCSLSEGCIGGPGVRKLVTFTVTTANISQTELSLGDPTTNPLFHFDQCHGHFHLDGFSDYEVLDQQGQSVGAATKTDWCLIDSKPYLSEPWVPPTGSHDCSDQGLSPGWADVYPSSLDCQWVDVTDVVPGQYQLKATVNGDRLFRELNYSNNSSFIDITLPDLSGNPDLVILPSLIGPTLSLEKRFIADDSAEVREGCVPEGGYRRVIRLSTFLANIAGYDLFLGDPDTHPLVQFDSSHAHYHLSDFLVYEVVEPVTGNVVASTRQEVWLPKDRQRHLSDGWVNPGFFYFSLNPQWGNPGLQRGWRSQIFFNETCQLVDVTDIPNGIYKLRITVNPAGLIPEQDTSNNAAELLLSVTTPLAGIPHVADGHFVAGPPLQLEPASGGLRLLHDTSALACGFATEFNVYYGLGAPGVYSYSQAFCDIGTTGDVVLAFPDPLPGQMLWLTVVARDGNTEGGHGFDSTGKERPPNNGTALCGVNESVPRPPCF